VRRAVRRSLVVLALAGALVGLMASPAFAHATLLSSTPQAGQVFQRAPKAVTLQFSEPVEAKLGGIRVFNGKGDLLDAGDIQKPAPNTVRVALPSLKDGTYAITWRVISADSHPVEGAFTFQVGAAGNASSSAARNLAQRLLARESSDQAVGALFGVARGFVFGGLALLIGAAFFAAVLWRDARQARWARRLAWAGWGLATLGTVAGFLLQGPYGAALPLGDAFRTSLIGDVLDTRFGHFWALRLGLLVLAIPMLVQLFARHPKQTDGALGLPPGWVVAAGAVAVALAATPGLAGHPATGDWATAAVVADTLHVLAMSVWLGGLVVLAAVALPARDAQQVRDAVPRFSRLALGCVAVLVATGAFQAWRQVGSLDALRTTDYGRILVVKLVLLSAIVVFAAFSREIVDRLFPRSQRRRVPAIAGGADDWDEVDEAAELRHLRRSVWAEIVFGVAVIAATALLVNAVPAKTAAAGTAANGATGVTLKAKNVWVDVTVAPGVKGRNDFHVSALKPDGAPLDVPELQLTIDQPDKKSIAPIKVPVRKLGPGHYLAPGFDIPFDGDWRVTARARLDEFNEATITGTISIR